MAIHETHPDIVNRLKRADGHIRSLIAMIESGRDCVDVAQQMHAICRALESAKQIYIRDHIDHCLERSAGKGGRAAKNALTEVKEIAKYL